MFTIPIGLAVVVSVLLLLLVERGAIRVRSRWLAAVVVVAALYFMPGAAAILGSTVLVLCGIAAGALACVLGQADSAEGA